MSDFPKESIKITQPDRDEVRIGRNGQVNISVSSKDIVSDHTNTEFQFFDRSSDSSSTRPLIDLVYSRAKRYDNVEVFTLTNLTLYLTPGKEYRVRSRLYGDNSWSDWSPDIIFRVFDLDSKRAGIAFQDTYSETKTSRGVIIRNLGLQNYRKD